MGSNIRNGLVVLHVFGVVAYMPGAWASHAAYASDSNAPTHGVIAETHATWYGEDGVGG